MLFASKCLLGNVNSTSNNSVKSSWPKPNQFCAGSENFFENMLYPKCSSGDLENSSTTVLKLVHQNCENGLQKSENEFEKVTNSQKYLAENVFLDSQNAVLTTCRSLCD